MVILVYIKDTFSRKTTLIFFFTFSPVELIFLNLQLKKKPFLKGCF